MLKSMPVILLFFFVFFLSSAKKIWYISTEHPTVVYYDPRYLKYVNLTSQRYNRANPFYYVGLHMETLVTFGNNVTFNFYFYEFLTNVYKRSFVEMHFKLCDLIHKDNFFGAPMKQGKLLAPCPYPPGQYNLYNMSIDVGAIPPGFPFQKGRIDANVTLTETKHLIAYCRINMEVKKFTIKD